MPLLSTAIPRLSGLQIYNQRTFFNVIGLQVRELRANFISLKELFHLHCSSGTRHIVTRIWSHQRARNLHVVGPGFKFIRYHLLAV